MIMLWIVFRKCSNLYICFFNYFVIEIVLTVATLFQMSGKGEGNSSVYCSTNQWGNSFNTMPALNIVSRTLLLEGSYRPENFRWYKNCHELAAESESIHLDKQPP